MIVLTCYIRLAFGDSEEVLGKQTAHRQEERFKNRCDKNKTIKKQDYLDSFLQGAPKETHWIMMKLLWIWQTFLWAVLTAAVTSAC